MANKNIEFVTKLGFTESTPKPPAITPAAAPAKPYFDNAKYDDYDSPPPKLIRKGETQF